MHIHVLYLPCLIHILCMLVLIRARVCLSSIAVVSCKLIYFDNKVNSRLCDESILLCICLQDLLLLSQKGGGTVSAELMDVQRKAKANGAVNHYKVLGLQQTASLAEIKAAYRYLQKAANYVKEVPASCMVITIYSAHEPSLLYCLTRP